MSAYGQKQTSSLCYRTSLTGGTPQVDSDYSQRAALCLSSFRYNLKGITCGSRYQVHAQKANLALRCSRFGNEWRTSAKQTDSGECWALAELPGLFPASNCTTLPQKPRRCFAELGVGRWPMLSSVATRRCEQSSLVSTWLQAIFPSHMSSPMKHRQSLG